MGETLGKGKRKYLRVSYSVFGFRPKAYAFGLKPCCAYFESDNAWLEIMCTAMPQSLDANLLPNRYRRQNVGKNRYGSSTVLKIGVHE